MEFPDLTDEQEALMGFFGMRRTDLNGGLTAGQIAEQREWPKDRAETIIQNLVDMDMLQPANPGFQTDLSENADPVCYGPTNRGFAWLEKGRKEELDGTVSLLQNLVPRGYR
jgi:hypothetical protein